MQASHRAASTHASSLAVHWFACQRWYSTRRIAGLCRSLRRYATVTQEAGFAPFTTRGSVASYLLEAGTAYQYIRKPFARSRAMVRYGLGCSTSSFSARPYSRPSGLSSSNPAVVHVSVNGCSRAAVPVVRAMYRSSVACAHSSSMIEPLGLLPCCSFASEAITRRWPSLLGHRISLRCTTRMSGSVGLASTNERACENTTRA
jgi:hypothetical protein